MPIQCPQTRLLNPSTAPEEARRYFEMVERRRRPEEPGPVAEQPT